MRQKKKILFTTFESSEKEQLLESIERTPEERLAFLKRLQQIKLDAPNKSYDIEDNRKRLSLKRKEREHKHGR